MCFDTRKYLSTKRYNLLMITRYIYYKESDFHEYSMLYCDNQKDYIYSMKYYTFISSIYIYVGINKCLFIQENIYLQ